MLSRELLPELTYWTPLIALVLSSLGLIALKPISGLPPRAQRLATPPFYFVSLPIETLIAGMEMFVWIVAHVHGLSRLPVENLMCTAPQIAPETSCSTAE